MNLANQKKISLLTYKKFFLDGLKHNQTSSRDDIKNDSAIFYSFDILNFTISFSYTVFIIDVMIPFRDIVDEYIKHMSDTSIAIDDKQLTLEYIFDTPDELKKLIKYVDSTYMDDRGIFAL